MVEDEEEVMVVVVVVEIENDRYYHVDAMDHSDVIKELDLVYNLDYFAIVVVALLEVIKVFVVDNLVELVAVAVVVVDVRNHDPRRNE
jgi:hypothetical protein